MGIMNTKLMMSRLWVSSDSSRKQELPKECTTISRACL